VESLDLKRDEVATNITEIPRCFVPYQVTELRRQGEQGDCLVVLGGSRRYGPVARLSSRPDSVLAGHSARQTEDIHCSTVDLEGYLPVLSSCRKKNGAKQCWKEEVDVTRTRMLGDARTSHVSTIGVCDELHLRGHVTQRHRDWPSNSYVACELCECRPEAASSRRNRERLCRNTRKKDRLPPLPTESR